jgi:hypothetical protein
MVWGQLRYNLQDVQAAGMIKVMQARVINEELAWAAVTWKVDSEK